MGRILTVRAVAISLSFTLGGLEKMCVPLSLSLGKQACMAARFAFYLGRAVGGHVDGRIDHNWVFAYDEWREALGGKAHHLGVRRQGGILAFGVILEEGRDGGAGCVVWMGGGVQGWGGVG